MSVHTLLGLGCSVIALVCITSFFCVLFRKKKPCYQKRFFKKGMDETFYPLLEGAYEQTESISLSLEMMKDHFQKGVMKQRIEASTDYLKHSRYKDYETALYGYFSSESKEGNQILTEILVADRMKMKRLPMKTEVERTEYEKK